MDTLLRTHFEKGKMGGYFITAKTSNRRSIHACKAQTTLRVYAQGENERTNEQGKNERKKERRTKERTMTASIVVIDTGTSNNASMVAALNTAANGRAEVSISNDASTIKEAELVVCPGVATFGNAMEALTKDLLVDVLVERVKNDRPTLFVCVGLQILAALSAESPNVRGLGIFPGALVSKIPEGEGILVPQQGWNLVQRDRGKRTAYRFLTDGHCYFPTVLHLLLLHLEDGMPR